MDKCDCCNRHTAGLHEHHIFMASLRGKDSPTCLLCADCHQAVHNIANRTISCVKKGIPVDRHWPTERPQKEIDFANKLVIALVKEITTTETTAFPKKVMLELPADLNRALLRFGKDNKLNKERAINALLESGLKARGYYDTQSSQVVRQLPVLSSSAASRRKSTP